jgi:hypoxanthine phosphoribosyltransferase
MELAPRRDGAGVADARISISRRQKRGARLSATIADPRLSGRTVKRIAFDEDTIADRVSELGAEITAAYPDGDLLVLGLLKGSFIFLSDLVRQIARPLQVDFLVASSYGDGMESSGTVRLLYDPETELRGKHILLVEDIVDSGRTLNRLMALLEERSPRSLEICALLHKRIADGLQHGTKFVGFDAPHEFLVGYGLDHAENFRHLPYIASLQ